MVKMKLIADSGSTKTDWCVVGGGNVVCRVTGHGINPFQQDAEDIRRIIEDELASKIDYAGSISDIEFYGAGCRDDKVVLLEGILREAFANAVRVEVCSDMLGAARALFGNGAGLACILGTGANSCLYDGRRIVANVPPLGYILGDEGSGAVLGRLFVNALFKGGLSESLRDKFLTESGLTLPAIINKVYREPMANRFLASLSMFIHDNLDDDGLENLVVDNFRNFFRRNVKLYGRSELPVGAVGSIAFYYSRQLERAAVLEGFELVKIVKSPMDELVRLDCHAY